jgi:hypothetical protein
LALAKEVLGTFADAVCGRGTNRAPLSHNRSACQWIAATILRVTSGSPAKARSSEDVVSGWRRPEKVGGEQGPFGIGLQDVQLHLFAGW